MILEFRFVLGLFACFWISPALDCDADSTTYEQSQKKEKATQSDKKQESTPVEHVKKKPRRGDGGLGTRQYAPSKQEKPYFKKLAAEEIGTGGLLGDYDIVKKHGKYVGWFGIVRNVKENKEKKETTLLIEHKYFDGLTDTHIQALSFNGSGDFTTVLSGVGLKIELLTLIKVYGKVAISKEKTVPAIRAQYVRNWHWGTFTFLHAFGKQRGNAKWRKQNKIELLRIYDPYPDDSYYQHRLGKRPSVTPRKQKR